MAATIDSPARASRLARTIASDIVVYMQANVGLSAEAQRLAIAQQIEQGRTYFRSRVSAAIDDGIYDEVVESLL